MISTVPVCVVTVPSKAAASFTAVLDKLAAIVCAFSVIPPVVAPLIVTNWSTVATSVPVNVTVMTSVLTVVSAANSVAVPVIVAVTTPLVAPAIAFNWVTVGFVPVISTVPVYVVPSRAAATSEALPLNATLSSLNVIAPLVAVWIVTSCASVGSSVRVTPPLKPVMPVKPAIRSDAEPDSAMVKSFSVIVPLVAVLTVTSCASDGSSVRVESKSVGSVSMSVNT